MLSCMILQALSASVATSDTGLQRLAVFAYWSENLDNHVCVCACVLCVWMWVWVLMCVCAYTCEPHERHLPRLVNARMLPPTCCIYSSVGLADLPVFHPAQKPQVLCQRQPASSSACWACSPGFGTGFGT